MKRSGNIRQYFPGGNTSLGFYSWWNTNIDHLERLYILKGGPGTGKSTLFAKIAKEVSTRGIDTELLWCSSDPASLDGVVFPSLSIGIVDGTAPHVRDPRYPGAVDKIINLGDYWDEEILLTYKKEIVQLTQANKELFGKTYEFLAQAKNFYDRLESLTTEEMDWQGIDKMTGTLIEEILGEYPARKQGGEIHRFAAAITPAGYVDYRDELLAEAKIHYILKGKAGTGKSTFIGKVASAALAKGFDVEYYHCSLDPLSIDSIYIPAQGLAVLDGNPPHDKVPEPQDKVVDLSRFISMERYEKNEPELMEIALKYKESMDNAFQTLKECKLIHDELEKYYIKAMDWEAVNQATDALLEEILSTIQV